MLTHKGTSSFWKPYVAPEKEASDAAMLSKMPLLGYIFSHSQCTRSEFQSQSPEQNELVS